MRYFSVAFSLCLSASLTSLALVSFQTIFIAPCLHVSNVSTISPRMSLVMSVSPATILTSHSTVKLPPAKICSPFVGAIKYGLVLLAVALEDRSESKCHGLRDASELKVLAAICGMCSESKCHGLRDVQQWVRKKVRCNEGVFEPGSSCSSLAL